MYGNKDVRWHGDRLYLGARLSGYSIVRDDQYPSMWRVRSPDGSFSHMVNRARAKDAAASKALAILNGRETGRGAPPAP